MPSYCFPYCYYWSQNEAKQKPKYQSELNKSLHTCCNDLSKRYLEITNLDPQNNLKEYEFVEKYVFVKKLIDEQIKNIIKFLKMGANSYSKIKFDRLENNKFQPVILQLVDDDITTYSRDVIEIILKYDIHFDQIVINKAIEKVKTSLDDLRPHFGINNNYTSSKQDKRERFSKILTLLEQKSTSKVLNKTTQEKIEMYDNTSNNNNNNSDNSILNSLWKWWYGAKE